MPLGRTVGYQHPHPERTMVWNGRGVFGDVYYKVYPTREAMARFIRRWESDAAYQTNTHIKALVPLTDGEGY